MQADRIKDPEFEKINTKKDAANENDSTFLSQTECPTLSCKGSSGK